jgi:SAM-dependent methyltransferase
MSAVRSLAAICALSLALGLGLAAAPVPAWPAQPALRAPDVPYEPSAMRVVRVMLDMGEVKSTDIVFDLGCGDGRVVIAAVRERGARGVCVDIDPQRIREARANAARAGVAGQIEFLNQDLFATDLRRASVVMLFLWPEVNLKLRPTLQKVLAPGTRIISHYHDMGDWKPERVQRVSVEGDSHPVYRWTVPAR